MSFGDATVNTRPRAARSTRRPGAAPAHAVSDPLRVRGQRDRHQRAHADEIDRRSPAAPHLRYFAADGLDVAATYDATVEAARYVRGHGAPAFLHLLTVRLLGHAGSDVEPGYRSLDEIEATESTGPARPHGELMAAKGILEPQEIRARYREKSGRVDAEWAGTTSAARADARGG